MALSARDRSVLKAIARQVREEDPALFAAMSRHGARSPLAWPVALMALCLAVFAVVLLLSGSPDALPHTVIR
ncbi:DUF3040 domain-containing protein [Nonomuraea spiralis]|uniref:DUF3040 domain-containing protein n=1 Tax=Nonomuraea spiralis TaxID=46182 RepID=A0ABV5IZ45_9ACTN|nr:MULTISPECIES: DUF3040 domain-containing protein [Nonomuraea]RSN15929.1 hypothetical protein DMB42_03910 [Nonomuraea sp. WAC 01424]GGS86606.1 hypothetical protein GCM10010176_032800 [Nonomuraea spiralis]